MHKIGRKKFEKMVEEGMEAIPERFLELLDNVTVVVEDEPTAAQKRRMHLGKDWTLFGLYEGIPQSKRGDHYTSVVPDKITIFRRPIEEEAGSEEEIKKIVKDTVWHEIAHHFGLEEHEVRLAEKRRKNHES